MQKKLSNYKVFKYCRLCDSNNLNLIYNFKPMPIGNDLRKSINLSIKSKRYPLKLMNCKDCNHFQLSVAVNPKILFSKNYSYLTGITNTFKNHFDIYAQWIIKKCNLKPSSLVIDIGSNDGTCLSYFKKNKMDVLGVDPAKEASKIANKNKIKTINSFFNTRTANFIFKKYGEVDFITSHNVLAHTENIKEIFESIFKILKVNGYFCFEIGYFKEVINKNLFDTIYHEHLDYHHANPLIRFLEKIGFSIVNLSTNNIQGGTLRILLQKKKNLSKQSIKTKNFLKNEKKYFKISKINNKFKKFNISMNKLNKIIKGINLLEKSVFAYGSPTKASLLLISSKLNNNLIKNTFEDNILKCNKYIPGTDIKIISSMNIKKINPKNIIILAWNFTDEIKQKLINLKLKNINLIIPLPKPKVFKL